MSNKSKYISQPESNSLGGGKVRAVRPLLFGCNSSNEQELLPSFALSFSLPLSLSTWNAHIAARQAWIHAPWIYFIFFFNSREGERERERDDLVPILAELRRRKNHIHRSAWKRNTQRKKKKEKCDQIIKDLIPPLVVVCRHNCGEWEPRKSMGKKKLKRENSQKRTQTENNVLRGGPRKSLWLIQHNRVHQTAYVRTHVHTHTHTHTHTQGTHV